MSEFSTMAFLSRGRELIVDLAYFFRICNNVRDGQDACISYVVYILSPRFFKNRIAEVISF